MMELRAGSCGSSFSGSVGHQEGQPFLEFLKTESRLLQISLMNSLRRL